MGLTNLATIDQQYQSQGCYVICSLLQLDKAYLWGVGRLYICIHDSNGSDTYEMEKTTK